MNQDSRVPLTQLQVDGGMTSNRLLMQLQADILCTTVGKHVHAGRRRFRFLTMQRSTKPPEVSVQFLSLDQHQEQLDRPELAQIQNINSGKTDLLSVGSAQSEK